MMKYKGYIGHVEFDDEAEIFHGEVLNIHDVITFQGKTPQEIKAAFHDSVDDYLAFCQVRNEEPEKPFSGQLVLNISPELHQAIFIRAKQLGKSIDSYIVEELGRVAKFS